MATRAELVKGDGEVGGQWVITGQKVWTSLAHLADWCFVLARTEPGSQRSQGLSYLLVPMRQPGVTVRPIRQLTGTSEFNEVFFDGARTDAAHVVGEPGDGWRIAKATLAVERGAAMLGQQVGFRRELENLLGEGPAHPGRHRPAAARQARPGLDRPGGYPRVRARHPRRERRRRGLRPQDSVVPLAPDARRAGHGGTRRRIAGDPGEPYDLDEWQRLFLFSRADTIYGGSDEIQRNIIACRALGLPRSENS